MPEIEFAANHVNEYLTFGVEDNKMKLPGFTAGADFFKIFSYPLLFGTEETALKGPESIAISRKMATAFFGSPEEAMDKSILFENYKDLKVTAVFEDLNANVSDKFEYVFSWDLHIERNEWLKNWGNSGPTTYIKLREHANAEALKAKLQHFIKNYHGEYSDPYRLELSLQPFSEKYLYSNFKEGKVAGGRIEYVRLFSAVAVFILLIACINFMNLSTARSLKRAKEVGVRKVNGALKTSLISQFMFEALLMTFISIVFALIAIFVLLPQFNLLTGKDIHIPLLDGRFWLGMLILTLVTGLVSGSYPAFLLSSFRPIAAIKEEVKNSLSSLFFRKGLVVIQFALSIIFIVGMLVIAEQVSYIQNKNLGYQKNNLIYIPLSGSIASNFSTFKQEAQQIPGILEVSQMSSRPLRLENTTGGVLWEGKAQGTDPIFVQVAVGYDFVKAMKSTIVAGRDFSEGHADSANYLINEKAMRIIGYQDPIGMPLTFWGIKGTIIGVVKDFHFNSLHVPIEPLVIRLNKGHAWGVALIRTDPEKTAEVIESLEVLHKSLNPDFPYSYQFAEDEYAAQYKSEQVVKKISVYFAFLAIFISCLGLLGLVIFSSEQRAKEVGIRKVLGASVSQIMGLLSKDFMKLVLVAILFSLPIAYYLMNNWLEGFEYRIVIQWWVFVAAAAGAVMIALLTISFQAIKAALTNPVNSLKSE